MFLLHGTIEAGYGKGPCDPTGGVAKRNADMAGEQQKAVIQDANDFFGWAKSVDSGIEYRFISTATHEENKRFLDEANNKVKPVEGTMKIHCVVKSLKENMLWVRETLRYNECCFSSSGFKYQMFCSGWQEVSLLKKFSNKHSRHHKKEQKQDQMQSIQSNKSIFISVEIGDFVAAVYDPEKKVYIGEVIAMDDEEVHVSFLQHSRNLSLLSVFRQPQIADKVWVSRSNVLCVRPQPMEMKRGSLLFERDVLSNVLTLFGQWLKK